MSKAPELDPAQDDPDVRSPRHHAVGLPAVANSIRVVGAQAGAKRGLPLLRDVNQTGGFDCPGCAWPEPGHRHPAEFCENGAKAVAEEGTRRRVDPDFFAAHAVADLAETIRLLARPAGPPHPARASSPRARPTTSPSPGTTPSR